MKVLNLGPKFILTKNIERLYMDVVQTTKICAADLEKQGKFSLAESLCQNIRKIILKGINKNIKII